MTLRLLTNSMADRLGVGGDIFGSALLPANEGFGVVANVYADRTRELADRREFEVILGWVIAHELGHVAGLHLNFCTGGPPPGVANAIDALPPPCQIY